MAYDPRDYLVQPGDTVIAATGILSDLALKLPDAMEKDAEMKRVRAQFKSDREYMQAVYQQSNAFLQKIDPGLAVPAPGPNEDRKSYENRVGMAIVSAVHNKQGGINPETLGNLKSMLSGRDMAQSPQMQGEIQRQDLLQRDMPLPQAADQETPGLSAALNAIPAPALPTVPVGPPAPPPAGDYSLPAAGPDEVEKIQEQYMASAKDALYRDLQSGNLSSTAYAERLSDLEKTHHTTQVAHKEKVAEADLEERKKVWDLVKSMNSSGMQYAVPIKSGTGKVTDYHVVVVTPKNYEDVQPVGYWKKVMEYQGRPGGSGSNSLPPELQAAKQRVENARKTVLAITGLNSIEGLSGLKERTPQQIAAIQEYTTAMGDYNARFQKLYGSTPGATPGAPTPPPVGSTVQLPGGAKLTRKQ